MTKTTVAESGSVGVASKRPAKTRKARLRTPAAPPTAGALPATVEPRPCANADDVAEAAARRNIDRMINAALGRLTQGLSPVTMAASYADWWLHLAMAPGKQKELVEKALRKAARLATYSARAVSGETPRCIEPLPQDKRFAAPQWQRWPFNVIHEAFLLVQQQWHNATTDVSGVSQHHEQVSTFMTRQLLDMVSPSNFFATNPELIARTAEEGGANLVRGAQYWRDDALRLLSGEPAEGTERFRPGYEVAVTPGKVVYRNDLIELIQYAPQTDTVYADPVLIVPSWIMKYYILDLSPENSLVRYLVERGHTVFMVSWKNPDSSDRDLGMDDYLEQGVFAALDATTQIVPKRPVNAVGYCLGGTLLAIAAATLARDEDTRLGSLTLLATELDFTEPGELSLFIDESQLAYLEDIMWERGYLDGKQMAGAFALLNSRDLVWSRMVRDYLFGVRRPMTDLMAWNADATRMPYRQHSEYLRSLYLNNDLAEGRYRVDGLPIALTDIRAPTFVVGTERDTVSPWKSVYKIHLLTDTEVTFCLTTGGHNVGVVNPPGPGVTRSHQITTRAADGRYVDPDTWIASAPSIDGSWWPSWEPWLSARAGARVAPPSMGAPRAGLPVVGDAPGQYVLIS
ncbi:MAG: alpha/beta fold hydrolase [Burkholderiaceae bacterium]|nr:alpha/beta fold hydrolase [Burkholderiaceae bacterium]